MSIAAAALLAARDGPRLRELPERPRILADAIAIQRRVSDALGPIGGWKVGAAHPDAPPSCAPMPTAGIHASPGSLPAARERWVEAEVAFRLGTDLPARARPYARAEIEAALTSAHPAIEWLEQRFVDPAAVDPLSLLADGLGHGGFVWGPPTAAWQNLPFAGMNVMQTVGEATLTAIGNPAGDMIRLVQWLADLGATWAGGLRAGQFVTCGSWTGKTALPRGRRATVRFSGLGEATLAA